MSDAFKGILQRMGKVIHRIDAPFVLGLMMADVHDAVEHRVTHVDVRAGHVNLGPQDLFPVLEFTFAHSFKQIKVFLNAAVTVRGVLSRFSECSAIFACFFLTKVIDIGKAFLDQQDGLFICLFKIT
jgi:hypothetical protein